MTWELSPVAVVVWILSLILWNYAVCWEWKVPDKVYLGIRRWQTNLSRKYKRNAYWISMNHDEIDPAIWLVKERTASRLKGAARPTEIKLQLALHKQTAETERLLACLARSHPEIEILVEEKERC